MLRIHGQTYNNKNPDPTPEKKPDPDPTPEKKPDPDPTPEKKPDPDPTPEKKPDPDPSPEKNLDPIPKKKTGSDLIYSLQLFLLVFDHIDLIFVMYKNCLKIHSYFITTLVDKN